MKHKKNNPVLLLVLIITSVLAFTNTARAIALFHTTYSNGIQQADDPTLIQKYTDWKTWFATQSGAGGYWRVKYNEGVGQPNQANGTASEGIGYAMLLAVWYDDKAFFDGLWNYKSLHSVKNGLMSWLVSSTGTNVDTNSATDADVDIAMALVLAYRRWGTSPTNYNTLANTEIAKLALDFCGSDFHAYPGDYCSCSSNDDTYPSYFTPAWYTEFGVQTGNTTFWNAVKAKAETMLASSRNAGTGLAPEKCSWSGAPVGTEDGYNSSRIPWRYSLDYIWNGTANSLAQITLDSTFFTGKSGSACAKYNVGGGCNDATHNGQRVGPAGTSMMIAGKAGELSNYYTQASAMYNDPGFFYNSTLALLALIQMSGNAPRMFGTPQPTPTSVPGDLFDDCEDGDNANNWGGYWYAYSDVGSGPGNSYMVPWPDNYCTKNGKPKQTFLMNAPGCAPGSLAYAARMTGNVGAGDPNGFFGIGSGTNAESGTLFKTVDVTMYSEIRMWIKAQGAGAGTYKYDIKFKCPASVTDTGYNDYKYTYTSVTFSQQVIIPFTSLTQATGWGIPVNKQLVLQNLTDVQFQTNGAPPIAGMDVEFDDIMFAPAKTPTPAPTFCPGEAVDDMEDGDNQNFFGGYWSTYRNTAAPASTVWPSEVTFTPFEMSAPGVNSSNFCARITGFVSNTLNAYVGMATNMNSAGTGRDLSMFNAVAFWVQGNGSSYSVKLMPSIVTNTASNDYKFTFKTVAGEWDQWVIPFTAMTQEKGWGIPVNLNTVLTNLQSVQFESRGINHAADLSIDEFEFRCSQGWTPTPVAGTPTDTDTPAPPTDTYTETPVYSPTDTPPPSDTPTETPVLSPTDTQQAPPSPTVTNTIDVSLPVDVLIDDCNDGDNANLLGGFWYTYTDANSTGGTSYAVPMADDYANKHGLTKVAFTMNGFDHITNAAGGAARVTGSTGTALGYDFIGMGTNFFDPMADHDISCCGGIRFYARSATGTLKTFRVKIGHPDAFAPPNTGENMYGRQFTVTGAWQLIDVPYANLTQETGWGTTISKTSALNVAQSIQFQAQQSGLALLDLEVDDLMLYSCAGGCMPTPVPTIAVPPTPTITVTPNVPLSDVLIDDCTDNDNANMLGGYWYTFDDAGAVSHSYVWPMSDKYGVVNAVPTYAFIMSSPGNGGAGFAARMTGTTTNDLGYDFIGMGTNFSEPKGPIQLNCCGGIRFYAKSDNPGAMASFRVKIGASAAYSCGESGDMYGKTFTVNGVWQMFNIDFASFTAEGWGAASCPPQPSKAFAMGMADSIQFQSTAQSVAGINLWIDDLYLTNCYPGCVAAAASPTYTQTPGGPTNTETPIVPTNTETPVVPTNTITITQTTGGPANTATRTVTSTATRTSTPGGATDTPTMIPTTGTLSFYSGVLPANDSAIKAVPNPGIVNYHSGAQTPITVDFIITRAATDVSLKLYTTGSRLVRSYTGPSAKMLLNGAATGAPVAGRNSLVIDGNEFVGLSQGTYYYVVTVKDDSTAVSSTIEKLILIRDVRYN